MTSHDGPSRRAFLAAGVSSFAVGHAAGRRAAAAEAGVLTFRVAETAGLRRFAYPVHTTLPGVADGERFRLERGGTPVPAQFRTVSSPGGGSSVALDFNASPGPFEREDYTVRFGEGVEPGPEPSRGLNLEEAAGDFRVSGFTVPENLAGFLRAVRFGRFDYVRPGSPGLSLLSRDRRSVAPDGAGRWKGVVTRRGPLAVGLRFQGAAELGAAFKPLSILDLTFPSSKSWGEALWRVADAQNLVQGLSVGINLLTDGEPTLVDLGASGTVYGTLKRDETMALHSTGGPAGPASWFATRGRAESPAPFAAGRHASEKAEGWVHVMDRTRCTALAVAQFGGYPDVIEVRGDGLTTVHRSFERTAPRSDLELPVKELRFWFHFVPMPVQIGAATSPQAMLSPLEVVWK